MDIELKQACRFIKEGKPVESYAVLVERAWPLGIGKQHLPVDEWAKHLAPSDELRKWYARQKDRWPEFKQRYEEELKPLLGELEQLRSLAKRQRLILICATCDTEHNQAVVLRNLLQQNR